MKDELQLWVMMGAAWKMDGFYVGRGEIDARLRLLAESSNYSQHKVVPVVVVVEGPTVPVPPR